MSNRKKLGLDDAYAVESPEDNVRLYADWASTYESEFVSDREYVLWQRVAEQLAKDLPDRGAPVLDVGCGTGLCGVALSQAGFTTIDGIDISDEMLLEAGEKVRGDGHSVYRNLVKADLTKSIDLDDDTYQGVVSAGTFTHGHLGPECLAELWRVAAAGAITAISINASHYKELGFAARIAADDAGQTISLLNIVEVQSYATPHADVSDGNERANILVCQVNAP